MPRLSPVDFDPNEKFGVPSLPEYALTPVDFDPNTLGIPSKEKAPELAPASGAFPAVVGSQSGPIGADTSPQFRAPTPTAAPAPPDADPGVIQESIGDTIKGAHSLKRGAFILGYRTGMYDDVDNLAEHMAASSAIEAQYPSSKATRAANEQLETLKDSGVGGILPALGIYAKNPRAALSATMQSLPTMLGPLATVPIGAGVGSLAGPAGAVAGGYVGLGVGSALPDYGAAIQEYAQDKWKLNTKEDWKAFFLDPARFDEADKYAIAHAGMVGLTSMGGGKIGGKVGGAVMSKVESAGGGKLAQVAAGAVPAVVTDAAIEAAGEAGGQSVGSKVAEGEFKIRDPGGVAGEFAGSLGPGGASVVMEPTIKALNLGGQKTTAATPEDIAAVRKAVEEAAGKIVPAVNEPLPPAPDQIAGSITTHDDTPTFYSPARNYIETKGPGAASPQQWEATLKNAPGVKQEELRDNGFNDWLAGQGDKVTKKQVLDYLDENAIRLEVTERQNDVPEGMAGWTMAPGHGDARYEGQTLPGDRKGYYELVMHTPSQNPRQMDGPIGEKIRQYVPDMTEEILQNTSARDLEEKYKVPRDVVDQVFAEARDPKYQTQKDFVGGHYPEPNVIAHMRVTERTDANGVPIALLEEEQSDWHQQGRREGYRTPEHDKARAELDVRYQAALEKWFQIRDKVNADTSRDDATRLPLLEAYRHAKNELNAIESQMSDFAEEGSKPPTGPFKQSWDELAFKRFLRWAADKGYRRIAWVNAAEQSRRYPGSGQRDAGMKVLYDQKIPKWAKQWAKNLGGTFGETAIGDVYTEGKHEFVQYIDIPQHGVELLQKRIPLYSEMKEASKKGKPGATLDQLADLRMMEFGNAFGPALDALAKQFGMKVRLQLHEGKVINLRDATGAIVDRYQALGLADPNTKIIHLALGYHRTAAEAWGTITHEFGHHVMWQRYVNASPEVRTAIDAAYQEYKSKTAHNETLDSLLQRRDNAAILLGQARGGPSNVTLDQLSPSKREYWSGFEEWFAEQVARWATTDRKPLATVEKFFHGLARHLLRLMETAAKKFNLPFTAEDAMSKWLNSFMTDVVPFAEQVNIQTKVETQTDNQKQMGPEEKAVEQQPETVVIKEMVQEVFKGRPPKEVQETLAYADKFNKIYKYMLGIHQVAQRNKHIVPLQQYTERLAVAQLVKQQIMIRAQEVLKKWNRLGGKQADAIAGLIDSIQNMDYLTPDEVKNKVARFPTDAEIAELNKRHKVSKEGLAIVKEVADTFNEHLTRYEAVMRAEVEKITDPVQKAKRHDAVTKQIAALRAKPYFPAMRFGDYTITVKNAAGHVIHFETFEYTRTRAAALEDIKAQMAPDDTVSMGKLDRQAKPLLGVPTQLLEMMALKLDLTTKQKDALEQLKFELSPAQSFKHRFQHKRRIAGYSQDFRRAYAAYFFHGANHLMKAQHADQLRALVKQTREETKGVEDETRRHEITAFMQDHLENWLDPKSDWAAIRSVAFLWALAFSPAAAAQNLTQTIMTTYPFLAANFGDVKAIAMMTRVGADFHTFLKKGKLENLTDIDYKAITQGIKDGIITEAMAPELAGYADGNTLGLGFGGNDLQRHITKFNEWGAKLFELAEQVNRRLSFRAAFKLAMQNPDNKYVKQMPIKHKLHYDQLRAEGWTETQAAAYVTARDAVITTQFQYGKEYAPRMFRGKARSIFVFKTFIQNYVVFLANYPQAAVRSLLILGFLGGLMGIPGAEDLKEILKALGWRLFGKDFDLEKEARKTILEFTGQDEKGRDVADLFLNGIARKGYGIPAFMDMLGGTVGIDVPMPTFDRSKAISAGTLLPVELGKLFGPPTQDQDKVIASQAQKASGAVFGAGFNVYKALTNSKLDWNDFKRWEKAVPRSLGSLAHAYRVGTEGGERTNTGSMLVKYDVRDTEQLMEVLGIAGGYTPFRSALQWDRVIAMRDEAKLWDIRRTGLMKQMGNAVMGKDQAEIDRVKGAIQNFNKDLPEEARGKAINSDALRASIGTQARSRQANEAESSTKKSDIPIYEAVGKLYPDSQRAEPRKVSRNLQ